MKRILAVVMSLVVVLGVCVVGTGCDPNKETEAEYKARIRKELDEIPVEATGYKLVHSDFPKPYKYFDCSDCGINATIETDEHFYDVNVKSGKGCDDESYGFEIAVDNGVKKSMSFNYDSRFKNFGSVSQFAFYDGQVFIVRRISEVSMYGSRITDHFPSTLFIYDYKSNNLKYMGYYEEWFNYSVYDQENSVVMIEKADGGGVMADIAKVTY